jgi:hypothetical protein
MLPSWIQEANWILQTTDPDRKPKEPTPPEIIDAFEVAKRLEYDDRAVIDWREAPGSRRRCDSKTAESSAGSFVTP